MTLLRVEILQLWWWDWGILPMVWQWYRIISWFLFSAVQACHIYAAVHLIYLSKYIMLYIFYWLSYDLDNSENITSVMHSLRDSLVSIKYQSKVSIICVLIIVIHPYAYSIQSYCMTFSYLNNSLYIYYVWFIFVFHNSWSIYCICNLMILLGTLIWII